MPGLDDTRVAVVIPLYGQPQFVTEAVSSVLAQYEADVTAVIVNDGCPDPQSHEVGSSLQLAFPDRVVYLRRPNGGLSAARNWGIRYALQRFPALEGVFLLDSDNALEPSTISALMSRLRDEPELDWVAPHIRLFGEVEQLWVLTDPFLRFRQLFENQADAAALFRPRVFVDAGYDEAMRSGYEDWEFYLDRLLAGCRGGMEPRGVVWYRARANSMLSAARLKDEAIRQYMRTKHRASYLPRARTTIEHAEVPRFLWIDEAGGTRAFTDPDIGESPADPAMSAFVVAADRTVMDDLSRAGLLRGLLFTATPDTEEEVVVITRVGDDRVGVEHCSERFDSVMIGIVATAEAARDAVDAPDEFYDKVATAREVCVGHPGLRSAGSSADQLIERIVERAIDLPVTPRPAVGAPMHRDFACWVHRQASGSTFPLADDGRAHIGFALPWLKLGGVEHCVLQTVRELRRLAPSAKIHALLTESGDLAIEPGHTWSQFDSVTVVAGLPHHRATRLAERWDAAMDVTVNAHSGIAYDALRERASERPWDRQSHEIAYLHVVDDEPHAIRRGWPMIAARLEPFIDTYLVISETMRATLGVEGVARRKIVHGPNAPVVKPARVEDALTLARDKAARLARGGAVRILIAGRLDHQKGGRRATAAIARAVAAGVDLHVSVLGEPTLAAEVPEFPKGVASWLGSTSDPERLAEHFRSTDVLLLLSRWEGVPLAMLDAMAHGSVVIATDVGGIGEVIVDGENGHLIRRWDDSDAHVAERAAELLVELAQDPDGCREMRERAVQTVWPMTWERTAQAIVACLPDRSGGQS